MAQPKTIETAIKTLNLLLLALLRYLKLQFFAKYDILQKAYVYAEMFLKLSFEMRVGQQRQKLHL